MTTEEGFKVKKILFAASEGVPFVKTGDAVLLQLNTTESVEVVGFTLK